MIVMIMILYVMYMIIDSNMEMLIRLNDCKYINNKYTLYEINL